MPSHLTRVVFRSIIHNRPLLYRGCLNQAARPRLSLQNGTQSSIPPQQRTFFNFLRPNRKAKKMDLPPGMEKLSELASAQRQAHTPPKPEDVAGAFNDFFKKEPRYERFHIRLAAESYKYIKENPKEDTEPWLSEAEIKKVFGSLAKQPEGDGQTHLWFGRILYDDIVERRSAQAQKEERDPKSVKTGDIDLSLVKIMCLYGAATDAREFAMKKYSERSPAAVSAQLSPALTIWTEVLKGFTREGNTTELVRTAEQLRELSLPFTRSMQNVLVAYYTHKGDLQEAKKWFSEPAEELADDSAAGQSVNINAAILKACALNGDLEFGQEVVASLVKDVPDKAAWDAVFVWSAAIGKGVEEIDRMMGVMVRRSEEAHRKDPSRSTLYPDIDSINALVDVAISKKDPYTAERFIFLGEKRGILPDAKTFTMQIQYRLSVNDIDGARAAYYGLQGAKDQKSVEVINQLVRAMCISKQHQFDETMAIVDDLHESRVWFDPETVAALSVLHLRRGEMTDAIDLLQVHAHHYSPEQRQVIRGLLAEFLLDRQTSTADAWDTYQIVRQLFPETTRDVRIRIMKEFFARERPDMACHVFFHMRNSTHADYTANREVYVAALTGFAHCADRESLNLVHNQLKLSLTMELDTQLRNALMLGYANIGDSTRAMEFWDEIAASKEGPSYNSIAIVLRVCERMPFGDHNAVSIWTRLKKNGVDIDRQIFTGFLCALGGNQQFEACEKLLETVEEEYGFAPDMFMLASWFNATANIERQRWVEKWIRDHYPDIWTQIEALGHTVTNEGFGHRLFKLDRNLEP